MKLQYFPQQGAPAGEKMSDFLYMITNHKLMKK